MNIAIIADPEIPVPPLYYGGIERIIDTLITGLTERGHHVTLFAHKNSVTSAQKFYPFPASKQNLAGVMANTFSISRLLFKDIDVVHSFGRLAGLAALLPTHQPKIMSYQREPTLSPVKKASTLSPKNSLLFTGCSDYITHQIKPVAQAETVYNAVSTEFYAFKEDTRQTAPLVFLGRIEPIKGPHTAISIAQKTKRKLIIAGNIPDDSRKYFDTEIAPYIDNSQISYIGPVNDEQKKTLLGNASALLMPIHWNEPFGIVMAEALACGTPVIAFARGAAKEIIRDGINGWLCHDEKDMENAVLQLNKIDRKQCRADAEHRFSAKVMTDRYEFLYRKMCAKKSGNDDNQTPA